MNKPPFVITAPKHRYIGGSMVNRIIGGPLPSHADPFGVHPGAACCAACGAQDVSSTLSLACPALLVVQACCLGLCRRGYANPAQPRATPPPPSVARLQAAARGAPLSGHPTLLVSPRTPLRAEQEPWALNR